MKAQACRFCKTELKLSLVDLGLSPVSNDFRGAEHLGEGESFYPLHVQVCERCYLAQIPEFQPREKIFNSSYAYFSSFSTQWLKHAEAYVEKMIQRFSLNSTHRVLEVASNDGYLLQYFVARGVPVLGIEPSGNVAEVARKKNVPTLTEFMGKRLGQTLAVEGQQADLIAGNNVVAHVPDINDFVEGLKLTLKPDGVITLEFPHLLQLLEKNQFDTIYHEHFSYLSLTSLKTIFEFHGLSIFDVEELSTHGGSLRIFGAHRGSSKDQLQKNVGRILDQEESFGIKNKKAYLSFQSRVETIKHKTLQFLIEEKSKGKRIVGYGAPAKGNTFLNYCGIRTDFIDFTVDRSPHKQGLFLPGTRIPVLAPEKIDETRPDWVFILPWNLREEISEQMKKIRTWGGKFVTAIPELKVWE